MHARAAVIWVATALGSIGLVQTDRGRTRDSVEVHEVGVVVDLPGLPLLGHLLHVRGRLLLQATQPRLHAI